MEKEIWVPIIGYEDIYEVSNNGRIRSQYPCHGGDGIRKLIKTPKGYLKVQFKRNGVIRRFLVHRLVGQHFIPNPENKPFINHKNGVKTDNRASEIEWCTTDENNKHAIESGLNKSDGQPVLDSRTGIMYSSKTKACKALRISNDTVNAIINGEKSGSLVKIYN